MDNFKFTKSFIDNQIKNEPFQQMNELNRMERIYDNMAGLNPFTKEKNEKNPVKNEPIKDIQNNQLRDQIIAMNNIRKD